MSLNHFRMSRSIALLTLVALVGAILLVDVASASTSSAVDSHDDHDDDHSGSTSVHDDDHDDDDDHDHDDDDDDDDDHDHDDDDDDHDHDDDDDDHDHDDHDEEEESVTGLKIMSILVITVCAYGVDLLVLAFPQLSRNKQILSLVSCFGGGIFAVVAVAHLLAEGGDIIRAQYTTDGHEDDVERFRPAEMVALLGYFTMLFLQRGIFNMEKDAEKTAEDSEECSACDEQEQIAAAQEEEGQAADASATVVVLAPTPSASDDAAVVKPADEKTTHSKKQHAGGVLTLAIMFLSFFIHGVTEGLALGLQTTKAGVIVIFVAIILHHWALDLIFTFSTGKVVKSAPTKDQVNASSADFASTDAASGDAAKPVVAQDHVQHEPLFSTATRIILSFCCSSNVAVGIAIGWGLQSSVPSLATAYITSFCAGTFIYFAFSDIVPCEMAEGTGRKLPQLLAFFVGMGVIYATLAAIYAPEAHDH